MADVQFQDDFARTPAPVAGSAAIGRRLEPGNCDPGTLLVLNLVLILVLFTYSTRKRRCQVLLAQGLVRKKAVLPVV